MFEEIKKAYVTLLKKTEIGSAVAVRLTKYTGKSKIPIHPKHLIVKNPWFTKTISRKDKILDLGSGNGQNSIKAAKRAKSVLGLEIDQNLLELANISSKQKNLKNVKFENANLEKPLKLKTAYFDKVIFLDVLEHLKKRDQIIKEINRILKKRGLLYLGVPNSETSWKKLQRSVGISSFSDPDHKIEFSEKSIKTLLVKHSFEIIHFGYGKFDTPFRSLFDIIGSLSLTSYRKINNWRSQKTEKNTDEASGFEIIAKKI